MKGKIEESVLLVMTLPVAFVIVAPLTIWTLFAQSFVLRQIWEWFAVPAGMPALSIRPFIGLALLVCVFHRHHATPKETAETTSNRFFWSLIQPWMALGFAWLGHWWFR